MTLIKQCFPVVGFVFLKKVVQAFEIVGEILKKKNNKSSTCSPEIVGAIP